MTRSPTTTMPFEFVPVESAEQSSLIKFLKNSFQAEPGLNSFNPEIIHWKYFTPHPDWTGPRSFAVKQAGEIVAHGGIWPVRLKIGEREIKALHLIDWAASRSAVGAGVYLLRKIASISDLLLTVGGSDDTRNLLPKLGYKRRGELRNYARVVRPWLHYRTTPHKNWKSPIKFVRNSGRALAGIPHPPRGWAAQPVETFTATPGLPDQNTPGPITPLRTSDSLNHLLHCPAAQFSGFLVLEREQVRGYFLLSTVGHQARIVDIRLNVEDRDSRQAICNLAASTAAENPNISEIAAASSVSLVQEAWLRAGFIHRRMDPILTYDPRALLPAETRLDLNLADGDLGFLSDPQAPYLL